MDKVCKSLPLLLVVMLTASCFLSIQQTYAQSISKPSVPDFTIQPIGPSFDIPPTYSFNASNGLFYVNEGYHFEYSTVQVIIKNQAFINQTNLDHMYYSVRLKPHNYPDSYWNELFNPNLDGFPIQSSSNYTIIPIAAEGSTENQYQISAGATTDIQVKAMIGHIERGFNGNATNQIEMYPYVFIGQTSDWSKTQTVTLPPKIPFTPSASTPTHAPSPTVPELSWLILLPLFLIALSVALILTRHKTVNGSKR
jgi:hypothetical protein